MTFRALLYAYILGGLTFIPLVLAVILGVAWTLLPKIDEAAGIGTSNASKEKLAESGDDKRTIEDLLAQKHEEIAEGGASGTFAVLRKYDFQAATAALNARNNASGVAVGSSTAGDSGAEAARESESVYQSMYRSVFDRGKNANQGDLVLASEEGEAEDATNARPSRRATPANVFYIVLRHGHLMLYDSASQIDVRHVISLAHHSVSLSDGGPLPGSDEHREQERNLMKDGELFIKRTALVLTPVGLRPGHLQSRNAPTKPFYLFASTCSDKEDFYHSLLYTRTSPPIPEPLDPNDAIKLQSTLHSTSLTPETRALNALVSRIFLSLYHTDRAKQYIQFLVEKKISRVQKPTFIASLALKSIDLGNSAPVLSNPRLKDLHISGDMVISSDVKYTGGFKLTFAAVAKLDLGPRFKTRTVDLVLAASVKRLQGHILLRIKPPPSNRFWFCFESPPDIDIKVEPVVSQRQITYTFILRQIEDRIRAVILETLVKPNWDDVPFFDTRGQNVRGGIWRDEGAESSDDVGGSAPAGAEILKERNTKTKSMPVLPGIGGDRDSSATSSGSEAASRLAFGHAAHASDGNVTLKRRSIAALPVQSQTPPPDISSERSLAAPPPPLRSPSYNTASAPSVALDESSANIDPARSAEVPPQVQKRWRIRNASQQIPSRKEAVEAMREMRDKASALKEAGADTSSVEKEDDSTNELLSTGDGEDVVGYERRISDASAGSPSTSQTSFATRSLKSSKRADTNLSSVSASSQSSQNQQRKQTILAATAAATNAARNWSWNAYQNAKKNSPARAESIASQQQQDGHTQPMGRGQPLPPPGVPLPGPNKGLFGTFGGSVKRKPVVPPRKATTEGTGMEQGTSEEADSKEDLAVTTEEVPTDSAGGTNPHAWEADDIVHTPTSDDFGPWRENSGGGLESASQVIPNKEPQREMVGNDGIRVTGRDQSFKGDEIERPKPEQSVKAPPPLPPRRSQPEPEPDDTSTHNVSIHEMEPVSPNAAPPAKSAEQAEAKFALGADMSEADFKNAPAHDSTYDTRTAESDHDDDDVDEEHGEIIAVPAPADED